jgi:hypothetical protein
MSRQPHLILELRLPPLLADKTRCDIAKHAGQVTDFAAAPIAAAAPAT